MGIVQTRKGQVYQPGGRWAVLAILCFLYALSFVDRFILAVLASPVTEALGLSNIQMGLLLGAGFALLYSLVGLPIAQLIDAGNRKLILIVGVILWSLTTILSSFAQDFVQLLICRSGVAIGEAVLTPVAISLIADLFEADERPFATSVYMSMSSFMATGAFIVGGGILDFAGGLDIGGMADWRLSFVIAGIPGLAAAAIIATLMREPTRCAGRIDLDTSGSVSIMAVLLHLKDRWMFYTPFFIGIGLISSVTFALISWAPSLVGGELGWEASRASYAFGCVGVPAALIGTFFWPWLTKRIVSAGLPAGLILVVAVCQAIPFTAILLLGVVHNPVIFLGLMGVCMFCLPVVSVLAIMTIQATGITTMHARLTALTLLVINLFGYSVGPYAIALIAANSADNSLLSGLIKLSIYFAPAAIIASLISLPNFQRDEHAQTERGAAPTG